MIIFYYLKLTLIDAAKKLFMHIFMFKNRLKTFMRRKRKVREIISYDYEKTKFYG